MGHSSSDSDSDHHHGHKHRKQKHAHKRHSPAFHGGGLVGSHLGQRDNPDNSVVTGPVQHFVPHPMSQPGSGPPLPNPQYGQSQPHGPFSAPAYPPPGHPGQAPPRSYAAPGFSTPNSSQGYGPAGYPTNQEFVPYGQGQVKESAPPVSIPTPGTTNRDPDAPQKFAPPPGPPPAYTPNTNQPPPSGHRIPLDTTSSFFPNSSELGQPVSYDLNGAPLYLGSALFPRSVHPCKIGVHLEKPALVAYGGYERPHEGRYDLLPFDPQLMEFVKTSHGAIPHGRRPVEGGYEEDGGKLYHAMADIGGVRVPGKTGTHLGGANVGFGGAEHHVADNYEILCWR